MNDEPQPAAMTDTEFLFRVGVAFGRAVAPRAPVPTVPVLDDGQRYLQAWSAPDNYGYRNLLTFELVER